MPTNKPERKPSDGDRRHRLEMPERIPDTPENIARACMKGLPKKKWEFLEEQETRESSKSSKS